MFANVHYIAWARWYEGALIYPLMPHAKMAVTVWLKLFLFVSCSGCIGFVGLADCIAHRFMVTHCDLHLGVFRPSPGPCGVLRRSFSYSRKL